MWATARRAAGYASWRHTLRVLVPRSLRRRSDRLAGWDAIICGEAGQVISLAYDGLVGYRRVSGAAGATIVGALATDAPRPSHDGRTYVFTLRRGLRYSDGLCPSIRRTSALLRPQRFPAESRAIPIETSRGSRAIVGARQCANRPARCDLSRGIETDSRARTITIHLTRPDGDFLHKLTQPFASSCVRYSARPPSITHHRTGPYSVRKLERATRRNPGAQSSKF